QEVHFTVFSDRLTQSKSGELRIDGYGEAAPQAAGVAEPVFHAGELLLEMFDHFADRRAVDGDSVLTAREAAQERWDPHDGHGTPLGSLFLEESLDDAAGRHGQLAQADADGAVDGIGDRGGGGPAMQLLLQPPPLQEAR